LYLNFFEGSLMNLDEYQSFKSLDPDDMLGHIDGLPDQLQFA